MELNQLLAKVLKNVGLSAKERSEIIIIAGKGRNRILLICDSWEKGTVLLDGAMEALDSIPVGKGM